MTEKMNISSAEESATGGRVLANVNLGFGKEFQCREIKPDYLEMCLTVTASSEALLMLADSTAKAIGKLHHQGVEETREQIMAKKREKLVNAMHTLRVAIISGNNESIINAGIEMEELREAAASYGGFLDNALSRECSQAMADALAMLR